MDKREAARVPVRVPALCRSLGLVIRGFVEDVSRNGLFLRAPKLVAKGSQARIELEMPDGERLCLEAEVVRVEHNDERAGMGLRLIVEPAARRPLANFIMRHHARAR
ncbi:MAG TPA: PilZ domain-containing protein [Kofleriaceae bacterium]